MNTWKGSFLSIRCLSLVLFLSLLVLQQTGERERERERTKVEKEKIRTRWNDKERMGGIDNRERLKMHHSSHHHSLFLKKIDF
jgi:hypothetical protein